MNIDSCLACIALAIVSIAMNANAIIDIVRHL